MQSRFFAGVGINELGENLKSIVIFGGCGFIGSFFAQYLIEKYHVTKVYLYDRELISAKKCTFREKIIESYPEIVTVGGDRYEADQLDT